MLTMSPGFKDRLHLKYAIQDDAVFPLTFFIGSLLLYNFFLFYFKVQCMFSALLTVTKSTLLTDTSSRICHLLFVSLYVSYILFRRRRSHWLFSIIYFGSTPTTGSCFVGKFFHTSTIADFHSSELMEWAYQLAVSSNYHSTDKHISHISVG